MNVAALIMAGGRSDRMREGGCGTHKALRQVAGTSLIERNVLMLLAAGVEEIWVAVNSSETEMVKWLDSGGRQFGLQVISERAPLGTVGAAGKLPSHVENAVVINVDNLTDLDIKALLRYHLEIDASATVATHQEPFRIPFGQVKSQDCWLTEYLEKPELLVTISSGTYVLHRRAIACIPADVRTDIPGLIDGLLQSKHRVACFPHSAWWIDVNDESALARAEAVLSARSGKSRGMPA